MDNAPTANVSHLYSGNRIERTLDIGGGLSLWVLHCSGSKLSFLNIGVSSSFALLLSEVVERYRVWKLHCMPCLYDANEVQQMFV